MADISGNPWNFVAADQAATAVITAIVRNGFASALVTTSLAHGLNAGQNISLQGNTPKAWNAGYQIIAVPTTTTFLIAIPPQLSTIGNATVFGNVLTAAYMQAIEVTQMLWDQATTGSLLITDLTGRTVWNPASPALSGTLTYMKAFPVFGLVLNTIGSGLLQISV